jgi:protein SCO1/2
MQTAFGVQTSRHAIGWLRLAAVLVALAIAAVVSFSVLRPIVVLPRIAPAPHFGLIDQQGNWLLDSDLHGQIVLYNFTYTHCTGACPQTSQVLRAVQDRVASRQGDTPPVALLTISFDVARDTPDALQQYAAQIGADPKRWHFATGTPADLKALIGGGFKTYYTPNSDGTFTFDPVVVLVDGNGVIRAEYRNAAPQVDLIMRDIGLVAAESRNSQGARRYAYEAAHLFVCYPR